MSPALLSLRHVFIDVNCLRHLFADIWFLLKMVTAESVQHDWRVKMPKFMFVYREGNNQSHGEMSPEEMQKSLQGWMDWIQGGAKAGWLIDGGDALTPEGRVVHPDLTVTDGPFAESKELVGGYSLVEAADFDAACEIAKSCPMPAAGGYVEVRLLANVGEPSEA
jgi:hypothetical protein